MKALLLVRFVLFFEMSCWWAVRERWVGSCVGEYLARDEEKENACNADAAQHSIEDHVFLGTCL